MNDARKTVLFLGKPDNAGADRALRFLRLHFDVEPHFGKWGDPLPEEVTFWRGDYLISYLGRWVVPQSLIDRAAIAAINFHPAPPEYPGIGCNNFALYDGATEYGVTAHHMAAKVDTGPIIEVRRFKVWPHDDVDTLLSRTYANLEAQFLDTMNRSMNGDPLKPTGEQWTGKPGSRKALNELATITADMTPEEVGRRIRATKFGAWKPSIEVGGRKFVLAD